MRKQELQAAPAKKRKAASARQERGIGKFASPKIEPIFDDALLPVEMTPELQLKQPYWQKTPEEMPAASGAPLQTQTPKANKKFMRLAQAVERPEPETTPAYSSTLTSAEEVAREQRRRELVGEEINLEQAMPYGRKPGPSRLARHQAILAGFVSSMRLFIQRLLAMLRPQARMSARGQLALEQLMQLYHLLLAQSGEDMGLVELKFAFGQAYFDVMQQAKRSHARKLRADGEDYSEHFVRFLRELDG